MELAHSQLPLSWVGEAVTCTRPVVPVVAGRVVVCAGWASSPRMSEVVPRAARLPASVRAARQPPSMRAARQPLWSRAPTAPVVATHVVLSLSRRRRECNIALPQSHRRIDPSCSVQRAQPDSRTDGRGCRPHQSRHQRQSSGLHVAPPTKRCAAYARARGSRGCPARGVHVQTVSRDCCPARVAYLEGHTASK